LSAAIGSTRSTAYAYLHDLEQANILRSVWGAGRNAPMLSKRKKLYQANTNSAWALCPAPPMGCPA
ncbi:MAG: hypothetical protein KUL87_04170, partial [Pseudomonas sp.]|nr:hypothetical protein [Pseudomonas sp.]